MKHRIQQGFTLIELLVVITIIAILASLAVPAFQKVQEKANMSKGINNARQIIISLRLYSGDNSGNYPDAAMGGAGGGGGGGGSVDQSNDIFRQLFISGSINDEMIFACPGTKDGVPDGNIGKNDPTYAEALKQNENHWAMTTGLTDSSPSSFPIVYENPAGGDWPGPTWNCNAAGSLTIGRSWSGGKVIVGMNDGSVTTQQCIASRGAANELGGQSTATRTQSDNNVFKQNDTGSGSGGATYKIAKALTSGGSGG